VKEWVLMMKSSDFRQKEVINIRDGKRLGVIVDMEFDLNVGRVTAVVVPGPSRWLGFVKSDNDLVIPWENIRKIGDDVILVDVEQSFTK
jgi:YlmC/YmxH family sporulation protein